MRSKLVGSNQPLYAVDDSQGDVRFSKPAGGTFGFQYVNLDLRCQLAGDFDVSVNYRDASINRVNGAPANQVQLNAIFGGQYLALVRDDDVNRGDNAHVYVDPPRQWRGFLATAATSGLLRIQRIGTTIRAWHNTTLIHTGAYNASPVTRLWLSLQNNGTKDPTAVTFGDFQVSAASIGPCLGHVPSTDVVLATNSIWLKENAVIHSGNVIVTDASPGPMLDSQVELAVGQGVSTPAGFDLKGNRIKVKQGAVVASDIFYNELTNNGTITGIETAPLPLPIPQSLPPFEQASAGLNDLTVDPNQSIVLAPGTHGDILAKKNGAVLFSGGGEFALRSLNTGDGASLLFDAPTKVLIEGKLDTDQQCYVGSLEGSSIGPADIVFYVAGVNGSSGNLGATPKAAQLGQNNTVLANVYAPNGTLWLRQGTVATGAFVGKDVIVGLGVDVTLASAFEADLVTATTASDGSPKLEPVTASIPEGVALLQNYPNPFRHGTAIGFALPEAADVTLQVYSVGGRLVRTLAAERFEPGRHEVSWDGRTESGSVVGSGIYLYQLKVSGEVGNASDVQTRRMILLK